MKSESRCLLLTSLALLSAVMCSAQEVGSIDLTETSPRTGLRQSALKTTESGQGYSGGGETYEAACRPSDKVIGALKTKLVSLDRSVYALSDQPRFQIQIENVGSEAISLPFSPEIARPQPAEATQKLSYFKMVLDLWIGGKRWESNTGGIVFLYGADDHTGTMMTLLHGQWITVIGKGKIALPDDFKTLTASGDTIGRANARTRIYQNQTLLSGNASATVSRGICLKETQEPSLPIRVISILPN